MRRYVVLLLMLIMVSCGDPTPTSTPTELANPMRPSTSIPIATWSPGRIYGSPGKIVFTALRGLTNPRVLWKQNCHTTRRGLDLTIQAEQTQKTLVNHTYYVAPNGDDSNPGTEAQPFRTITKGVSVLDSGDTLYIREGTYYEQVTVSSSGTAASPITISAYPGEHPIIDAQDTLPGGGSLVVLDGDYITLAGLDMEDVNGIAVFVPGDYNTVGEMEIENVNGSAVFVAGDHNTVRNMKIHHVYAMGILVGGYGDGEYCANGPTCTGNIIEDNEVWMASLMHKGVEGPWAGAIDVGRCPQYTIVRRNVVHENWGIGIQAYEAYNTVIEDNVVWNNQMSHYYVNCAPHSLVQRNLAYSTPDSIYLYRDSPGAAFAFCDERSSPVSRDIMIINNLSLGTSRGFYFFNEQPSRGLKGFLIANNTFIDSRSAGLQADSGDHESCHIYNNIIFQENSIPLAIVPDDPGLSFSHNLWSGTPPANASGPGDVIRDPRLTREGPIGPGLLDPDWFKLLSDSPAIDAGITLSEVPDDFDGVPRPRGTGYDIGAYESPHSTRVTDLRVVGVVSDTPSLTVTLRWTAPASAVTYSLRSSDTLLTMANWSHASAVTMPFTASEPGSSEWLTTPVYYTGGTLYLALKSQNSVGIWSELSNNAFWPRIDNYLPLIMKDYISSS